ncbi:tetraprenyl-beta-curcumene synthase family protein [Alicyclobacillus cycloheptanicus]|nr:tetraprenyl-beta-curcumene synthase family protein [Alicyclobacillus cycloheptanicus]
MDRTPWDKPCPTLPSRFLLCLFRHVLPEARAQIARWTDLARTIPAPVLRAQALASLQHKRFHADGGCVYAAAGGPHARTVIEIIVALQTISDYLDNLCDRCGSLDEADFTQLHHAMRDAVAPGAALRSYYKLRGEVDDGGYLATLVRTCQAGLETLPGYPSVQAHVQWLVERYCELQQIKHIEPAQREPRLRKWAAAYLSQYPDIEWWEFAAAAGSTLAVFALITASAAVEPRRALDPRRFMQAYFPWICGLHILLDYLIDWEEDERAGDFNFVHCYPSTTSIPERLCFWAQQSLQKARELSDESPIHTHVIYGLLAMYLSDRKAARHPVCRAAKRLVFVFGPTTWLYYGACVAYRFVR